MQRQFDPKSPSFIPRAFSLTHINLTHRNWTAVGLPGFSGMPVVDPRGMVMPFFDSWSLDAWIISCDGSRRLIPSREAGRCSQQMDFSHGLAVVSRAEDDLYRLESRVQVALKQGRPVLQLLLTAGITVGNAWLVLSVRPYNPEGISFVDHISFAEKENTLCINHKDAVILTPAPDRYRFSDYRRGDVYSRIGSPEDIESRSMVACDIGMATAACMYALEPGSDRQCMVEVALAEEDGSTATIDTNHRSALELWEKNMLGACRLSVADKHHQFLFDAALRTVVLHAADRDVYAGPFTYKRFWIRDAVFAAHALMCAGLIERCEYIIKRLLESQETSGYFVSQRGEWDSNGQVLWALQRFCELTGRKPAQEWLQPICAAWRWIKKKRRKNGDILHAGLLPPGFSAEHLGPSDCYYWDDFWSVAGLQAGAQLLKALEAYPEAAACEAEGLSLMHALDRSLEAVLQTTGSPAMPASPTRRLDGGAIGSLAASYPLQLYAAEHPRVLQTVEYLLANCLVRGAYFHDIIHAGINPYLTLHLAQALLRAGDGRYAGLMDVVAGLASSTGQWPEAIHPQLLSGCMGDGQHVWAASEWILMVRNCFVREETDAGKLILCSGVRHRWYGPHTEISFGPAQTAYGPVSLSLVCENKRLTIFWKGRWRDGEPRIEIALPGHDPVMPDPGTESFTVSLEAETNKYPHDDEHL